MKNFTRLITLIMCTFAVMITTDVKAFQNDCLNYKLFLADIPLSSNGGDTTLYSVDMTSTDASLTEILARDFEFHLAYNNQDDLIYLVKGDGTGFETIDGFTGVSIGVTMYSMSLGKTTTAVYSNGLLYIGSQAQGKIVAYDFNSASYSVFATNIPISGGDIIENDGSLYLATKAGNKLYRILNDGVDNPVNIPGGVTGISLSADGSILMSHTGSTSFKEYDSVGNLTCTSYPVYLDGQEFTFRFGDMAGGCNLSSSPNPEEVCEDYQMFYSDIKGGNSDIYGISLSGDTADLTLVSTLSGNVHISYDTTNGNIYAVDAAGTTITTITSSGVVSSIDLADGLNTVVTNVYKNGKIYLASTNLDIVVEVNVLDGSYIIIASDIPVTGGDLVFNTGILTATSQFLPYRSSMPR